MAVTERPFMKLEGVQIWEVTDGLTTTYKSDPIDGRVFACSTLGELQVKISVYNFSSCQKRSCRAK